MTEKLVIKTIRILTNNRYHDSLPRFPTIHFVVVFVSHCESCLNKRIVACPVKTMLSIAEWHEMVIYYRYFSQGFSPGTTPINTTQRLPFCQIIRYTALPLLIHSFQSTTPVITLPENSDICLDDFFSFPLQHNTIFPRKTLCSFYPNHLIFNEIAQFFPRKYRIRVWLPLIEQELTNFSLIN